MCHPLLLLSGGGGVHGKGFAPRTDEPTVLKLPFILQRFQLNLNQPKNYLRDTSDWQILKITILNFGYF